jgi:SAM-dependent methyltransferase
VQELSAAGFYQSEEVASRYEHGRTARVFLKDPLRILSYLERGEVSFQIPLYSFLDWIYSERLVRYTSPVLHGEILDIACGTSYVYRSLMEDGWKGRVSGFDSSEAMLAEGTRRINGMLYGGQVPFETLGRLYLYKDRLGREVLDFGLPADLADRDSLIYMRDHRRLGDATAPLPDGFTTVTAFSGPLCFFPRADQLGLLAQMLSGTAKYASLQFKNAAFYSMNSSPSLVKEIGGLIEHLIENRVIDSYAYLQSIDYTTKNMLPAIGVDAAVEHEVGGFCHYPVSLEAVLETAEELGFTMLCGGSMGFASETFFELLRRRYAEAVKSPTAMREFFLIMAGVDEYFCTKLIWGENLHLTLVRRSEASFTESEYLFEKPYRLAYVARTDGEREV